MINQQSVERLFAAVAQLDDRLAKLHRLVERVHGAQPNRKPPSLQDRKAIETLYPEIARSLGVDVAFTVRDLVVHGKSADPLLLELLACEFGCPIDRKVTRRIGDFFKRNVGIAHDGLRVERITTAREGALLVIRR